MIGLQLLCFTWVLHGSSPSATFRVMSHVSSLFMPHVQKCSVQAEKLCYIGIFLNSFFTRAPPLCFFLVWRLCLCCCILILREPFVCLFFFFALFLNVFYGFVRDPPLPITSQVWLCLWETLFGEHTRWKVPQVCFYVLFANLWGLVVSCTRHNLVTLQYF